MQIRLDSGDSAYHIRAYGNDFIQVNDHYIHESFIISPTELIVPWKVDATTFPSLSLHDLTPLLALQAKLILLGTGHELIFPSHSILHWFTEQHIGIDVMTTPAACRHYTALVAEGRSVAAALVL